MREEKVFAELRVTALHLAGRGDAAQRAAEIELRATEGERHKPRARRDHPQPQLPRDLVGEITRAQLRQR